MLRKLEKWQSTKPATKAAWIAASTGILTLVVTTIQAYIYYRQTKLIERQLHIAQVQSDLIKTQTQLTTRSYVEVELASSNETKGRTLVIRNRGAYPVRNIQITFLYFAKVTNHGWRLSLNSFAKIREAEAARYSDGRSNKSLNPASAVE